MAQRNSGNQSGNYKIPNRSAAVVKAPNTIIKENHSGKVNRGGDLRSGKSNK